MAKSSALVAALLCAAGSAHAADLPGRKAALAPALVASQWGGWYLGASIGAAQGDAIERTGYWVDTNGSYVTRGQDGRNWGALGGLHLGYNVQRNRIVYGLELQASLSNLRVKGVTADYDISSTTVSDRLMSYTRTPISAALLGRMGYTFDQALVYVAAGPAVGQVARRVMQVDDGQNYQWLAAGEGNKFDRTRYGWSAGAGIEYKLSAALSARAQYMFTDLGSPKFHYVGYPFGTLDQGDQRVRTYQSAVTVGVSYAFGK